MPIRLPRALLVLSSFIAIGCSGAGSGEEPSEDALVVADSTNDEDTATRPDSSAPDSRTADSRTSEGGATDTAVASEVGKDTSVVGETGSDTASSDTRAETVVEAGPSIELVIMPFGDSITGEPHTYREPLYTKLVAAGCTVKFVGSQTDVYASIPQKDHEGHPGFTIGDMAKSTDTWMSAHPPKIVLMMIGTNDIAWWYAGTAAEVADAHAKLLDQILADAPTAWVVAASIPPESSVIVEPNKYDRATFTNTVNAEIKKRIDARITAGKKVRFADVNAALTVADLRDGIHPTVPGYAKIADVWFTALKPIAGCLGGAP
jgi:hypothetical protein